MPRAPPPGYLYVPEAGWHEALMWETEALFSSLSPMVGLSCR